MAAGPASAAAEIDGFVDITSKPRRTVDVLTEIILMRGWYIGDDAAEQASIWLNRFVMYLKNRREEARRLGSFVCYDFNSYDDNFIQGSCFCEPRDDPATLEAKSRRANTIPIAARFDTLSPIEFETLCGAVLWLFGVTTPKISRRSADGGIDFYGQAPFAKVIAPERMPAGIEKDLRVWIVGQAKHYKLSKVSTKDLRELIGSTELARSKIFAGTTDPLDSLGIRVCDPVFYMIITSGNFTADSRDLISRSGIIAIDQMQLAQLLADNGIDAQEIVLTKNHSFDWLKAKSLFNRSLMVGTSEQQAGHGEVVHAF
jgi:hypothetical protein